MSCEKDYQEDLLRKALNEWVERKMDFIRLSDFKKITEKNKVCFSISYGKQNQWSELVGQTASYNRECGCARVISESLNSLKEFDFSNDDLKIINNLLDAALLASETK